MPRALLTDLNPDTIDEILSKNRVNYDCDASVGAGKLSEQDYGVNRWFTGRYSTTDSLKNAIIDLTRKEIEKCDALAGF